MRPRCYWVEMLVRAGFMRHLWVRIMQGRGDAEVKEDDLGRIVEPACGIARLAYGRLQGACTCFL